MLIMYGSPDVAATCVYRCTCTRAVPSNVTKRKKKDTKIAVETSAKERERTGRRCRRKNTGSVVLRGVSEEIGTSRARRRRPRIYDRSVWWASRNPRRGDEDFYRLLSGATCIHTYGHDNDVLPTIPCNDVRRKPKRLFTR